MKIFNSIALVLLSCYTHSSFAQLHDNTWLIGYKGGNSSFGITRLTFEEGHLNIQKDSLFNAVFSGNNAVYSDAEGNFFAAFNGYWIYNAEKKKMLNGDSIWYETLPYLYGYSDGDIPQGGLFLPWPAHRDSVIMFYNSQGNGAWPDSLMLTSLNLFYAVIRRDPGSTSEVVARRVQVLSDTLQYGRLTAVKHANGRDWWILMNERSSDRFYRLLLDPSGVHKLDSQIVEIPLLDGLGQAVFSPDGSVFAIKSSLGLSFGNTVDVFHFDRCTGYLSNQKHFHFPGSAVGGVAISPNSRYMYVSFYTSIYQYDLYADNLDSTRVLIGSYEPDTSGEFPATFFTMQLAPDHKIYMCGTNSVRSLHVIHQPDQPGLLCDFQQRGIQLPTYNSSSVSYSPNFRLGPIDGSSCDTLGLDNIPHAFFRWESDTLSLLKVRFTDLSYYEPETWSWDFGDNDPISTERNPVHNYDASGVYEVCLTVSNGNGAHQYCKNLYLGVSSQYNPFYQNGINLFPNPFQNRLIIAVDIQMASPVLVLYNAMGQPVMTERPAMGIKEVDASNLPPGLYYWTVNTRVGRVRNGKLIKY